MRKLDRKSIITIFSSLFVLALGVWFYSAVTVQNTIDNFFNNIMVEQDRVVALSDSGMRWEIQLTITNTGVSKGLIVIDEKDCYILIDGGRQTLSLRFLNDGEKIIVPSLIYRIVTNFSFSDEQASENIDLESARAVFVGKIKITTSMLWVKKTVEREFRAGFNISFPTTLR